jgi:hypothetical protein
MATGDGSGTWGETTNLNLSMIAEAFSYQTEATFGSDADVTATIADGASDKYRAMYIKVTSTGSLTATRTLTVAPTSVSKMLIVENGTSGSQSISVKQGSGATVAIPNGKTKVLMLEGTGSGAGVIDALDKLALSSNVTINDETPINASSTTTFTNKTFDANGTGNSITNIENADISASAAIAFSKMANLTASKALQSDGNGDVSASGVTNTELGYVSGVTSAIQTQLNSLSSSISSNDSDISTLQSGKLPTTVNLSINSSEGQRRFYFFDGSHTMIDSAGDTTIRSSGSIQFTVGSDGTCTAAGDLAAFSDISLKEDIYQIENALEKVNKLRGVHFTRKATQQKEIGVVANEVEKVIPELVGQQNDTELGTIKTMKYANTVGLLIEAVKELSKQVEDLKNGSTS